MKELLARLSLETPRFFRRLSAFLISLGLACAGALAGADQFNLAVFPHWAEEWLKIGAFVGFIAGAVARLPVENKQELNDKLN